MSKTTKTTTTATVNTKKATIVHNIEVENKALEARKSFFTAFCKAFNTKTVYAEADNGTWKPEFQYVHIFQKDTKHQLFYYQYTARTMYFVVNPAIAALVAEDAFITRNAPVIKKNKKTGAPMHTCSALYVDPTDIAEVVKFAKRLTAAAKKAADAKQASKSKPAEVVEK